ncbi:MAG: glycosyltransferase family 4 protein [Planctomycetota bacterium]
MNILQIISGRNVNGAVTYCKFLSEQLIQSGHQVTVLCRSGGWLQEHLHPQVNIFESELNRSTTELFRVSRWIRQQRFDVMHTHMSRAHTFGVLMKMMNGTPVVATAHQCSFQLHWRLNDFVIANSKSTAAFQRRYNFVPPEKLGMIHCFTDLERFKHIEPLDVEIVRRQLRLKGNEFLVGTVGDVIARKGQRFLFEALPMIVREVPNFKLVLLGRFNRSERYIKQLRHQIKSESLFTRVKWLGLRDNVQDFMAAFDLCVVPSVEEPLGLVAMEALAAGTPVVASNTGGLPEIVDHGVNGLLAKPKDPQQLAKAIIELARDPERRLRMGEAGRATINFQFDPKRLANQVVGVYDRLVAKRRQVA